MLEFRQKLAHDDLPGKIGYDGEGVDHRNTKPGRDTFTGRMIGRGLDGDFSRCTALLEDTVNALAGFQVAGQGDKILSLEVLGKNR